jgi:hypothetical protein
MKPICSECGDAARKSILQEIREGLKNRGIWVGEADSDILSAIFGEIDQKREEV